MSDAKTAKSRRSEAQGMGEPGEGGRESPIMYPARRSDFCEKICVHREQKEQGDKSNNSREKKNTVETLRKRSSEECKRQRKQNARSKSVNGKGKESSGRKGSKVEGGK